MTKNAAINLAIKVIRRWAREMYGFEAKYNQDARHEWDRLMEVVRFLEGLKDGGKNG